MASQFELLKTKRFLPLFVVQFLGAFNDNLLKTVLVVLIAYGIWDIDGWEPAVLVAVAAGLFILPFILFCPLAGNLSDKFDKSTMIRAVKWAELGVAFIAVGALYSGNIYFAIAVLLALGTQSAFFSPAKFSILPQHLKSEELVGGNALVSTGTYMAILAGTIVGAGLAPLEFGVFAASIVIVIVALVGLAASYFIPTAPPPTPDLKLSMNFMVKAYEVLNHALKQRSGVLVGILGVSYFYFVAATFHSQFPNFTSQTLGADNIVLIAFMVAFSFGVAIGGLLNHRVLNAQVHGAWVPLSCVLMAVFGVDIYFAAKAYPSPDQGLHDLATFVGNIHGARLLADTFFQAVACGFFVIPLRAIVQDRAAANVRSRVISSSNMMDAVFIFTSSVLATALLSWGASIEELYLIVSVLTVFVGLWLFRIPSLRANYQT